MITLKTQDGWECRWCCNIYNPPGIRKRASSWTKRKQITKKRSRRYSRAPSLYVSLPKCVSLIRHSHSFIFSESIRHSTVSVDPCAESIGATGPFQDHGEREINPLCGWDKRAKELVALTPRFCHRFRISSTGTNVEHKVTGGKRKKGGKTSSGRV